MDKRNISIGLTFILVNSNHTSDYRIIEDRCK